MAAGVNNTQQEYHRPATAAFTSSVRAQNNQRARMARAARQVFTVRGTTTRRAYQDDAHGHQ